MTYYPPNRIKTNLYTSGNEYVIESTNKNYIGYFWKKSSGEIYTGKSPTSPQPQLLIKVGEKTSTPPLSSLDKKLEANQIQSLNSVDNRFIGKINSTYSSLKRKKMGNILITPSPYYPQPTENDYEISEFQRYFCVKSNELKYTEVTKEQYNKFKNKDDSVAWQYYIAFSLPWNITGEKKKVFQINKNIVLLTEKNLKRKGLQEFLREDYLKFHKYPEQNNLYTKGGELKNKNNVIYVGYYHVHETLGPMEGKSHTSKPHNQLYFMENSDVESKIVRGTSSTQTPLPQPYKTSSQTPPTTPTTSPSTRDTTGGGY